MNESAQPGWRGCDIVDDKIRRDVSLAKVEDTRWRKMKFSTRVIPIGKLKVSKPHSIGSLLPYPKGLNSDLETAKRIRSIIELHNTVSVPLPA